MAAELENANIVGANDSKDVQEKDGSERSEELEVAVAHGELDELTVVAEGEERTTLFVWLLVSCATISGLLFGESIAMIRCIWLLKLTGKCRLRYRCHFRSSRRHRLRLGTRITFQHPKGIFIALFFIQSIAYTHSHTHVTHLRLTGTHHLGHHARCPHRRPRRRSSLRLHRTEARPRDRRRHLLGRLHRSGALPYGLCNGEHYVLSSEGATRSHNPTFRLKYKRFRSF
jgi:hypothetical protein